jgi:polysaccharide biosynthesis PFTS motif protein
MRGYQILKETDRLDFFIKVKDEITNLPLSQPNNYPDKGIFGAGYATAELSVRQFLISRLLGFDFNKQLLIALCHPKRRFVYPLPREWRIIIEKYGFKTQTFKNRYYWLGYKLFFYLFGLFTMVSIIYHSLKSLIKEERFKNRGVYFHGLSGKNLPSRNEFGPSQDIISWYLNWSGRKVDLEAVYHTVPGSRVTQVAGIPMSSVYSGIPPLAGFKQFLMFIFWSLRASIIGFIDIFTSGFFNSILLGEGAKAVQFRTCISLPLSYDYLFHNSGWIYRPLWTYEAEKKGGRILFYFYSTNCENFNLSKGESIQANSWQIMSWSHYLVWDTYQSDFVKKAVGNNANVQIVGPIWFHTDNKPLPQLPSNSIAVFDIQPHRDSRYQSFGLEHEFFTYHTMNSFLADIHLVTKEYKSTMILKRKRHIGKLLNSRYQNLLNQLEDSTNFLAIDPDISAFDLIQKCSIVISIPFTSTAIIAKEMGKISVYYDPTSMILKDDKAAHGIEIISGRKELFEWFGKLPVPRDQFTLNRVVTSQI